VIKTLGTATFALVLIFPIFSHAFTLQREAISGKKTVMWRYSLYRAGCLPEGGVVKVLAKPQHGKLSSSREIITLRRDRFTSRTDCIGKQLPGFVVHYTSVPGFRGTDTFQIELTHPRSGSDVDTFTVNVR
jgi:hypothetical protein